MFITVETLEEVTTMIQETTWYIFIYKHSATCPTAIMWKRQVEKGLKDFPKVPCIYVHVRDNRELSNQIEEHFNIKHETPQLITFKNGKLKDVKNHHSISDSFIVHTINWWYNG